MHIFTSDSLVKTARAENPFQQRARVACASLLFRLLGFFLIPYPFREKKHGFNSKTVGAREETDRQKNGEMDRGTDGGTDSQPGK